MPRLGEVKDELRGKTIYIFNRVSTIVQYNSTVRSAWYRQLIALTWKTRRKSSETFDPAIVPYAAQAVPACIWPMLESLQYAYRGLGGFTPKNAKNSRTAKNVGSFNLVPWPYSDPIKSSRCTERLRHMSNYSMGQLLTILGALFRASLCVGQHWPKHGQICFPQRWIWDVSTASPIFRLWHIVRQQNVFTRTAEDFSISLSRFAVVLSTEGVLACRFQQHLWTMTTCCVLLSRSIWTRAATGHLFPTYSGRNKG